MTEDTDIPRVIVDSIRELARQLGVGHTTVLKALESQRIHALPDGRFDVEQCRADWRANTKRGRPSVVTMPDRKAKHRDNDESGGRGVEQVEVPADAVEVVTSTLADHGSAVQGKPTLFDAQTAHEILKARKSQLEVNRLLGKQVDKEKAHTALTLFTQTVRNHLLAWPAADAASMASDLGLADLTKVENVVLKYLRAQLELIAVVPPPDDLLPVAP